MMTFPKEPGTDAQEFDKVTIYTIGEMFGNVQKVEARKATVEIGPYAQHKAAVHVRYLGKGKRKWRGFVRSYRPYVVILEGHGHPDPNGLFTKGETSTDDNGTECTRAQYSSFDEGWVDDWAATLEDHLAKTGAKVLFREEKSRVHENLVDTAEA